MGKRGSGAAGQRGSGATAGSLSGSEHDGRSKSADDSSDDSLPRRPAALLPRLIDLSHAIEDRMITYPGIPGPIICDYLSRESSRARYAAGVEFQIGKIEMVANTGTYLDAPFHRYADGKDLAQLPLESLADLDAVVVRPADAGRAINRSAFDGVDLEGKAVLVQTGWDIHWRTERYLSGHPFLTADAAEYLMTRGVVLVGIDSLNIDDTGDLSRPVHSTLLAAGIPIVEHMCNLSQVPERDFRFFAVPTKVAGFGSWPVRAFANVLSTNDRLRISRRRPSLG
ncbi:MAG TPA: cyclase family protein [Gemmatimonadales bacterium]|nr:cyclase family protein [Gemmatimonadales bacterium]